MYTDDMRSQYRALH